MIIWLLKTDSCSGAYNGTAPQPVTNREFTAALASALHRFALIPAPAFALKAALGEMSELLLTGQKVVPGRFRRIRCALDPPRRASIPGIPLG